jgi:hypothetical protein
MAMVRISQIFFPLILLSLLAVAGGAGTAESQGSGVSFTRLNEPREGAFTILAPRGWKGEGGIFRINPLQAGGPLNSMEAKCDLTLKSDDRAAVAFRILPDVVYAHVGIGAGAFPPGSNYQGAIVRPLEDARTHLQALFSSIHPRASGVQKIKMARLPGEIQAMEKGFEFTNQLLRQTGGAAMTNRSDAAGGVFEYTENGVRFREVMVTGIVDMRAALTWKNTRTILFRAAATEFDLRRPLMDIIRFSLQFNPQWVIKEAEGQRERAEFVLKVYEEIRRLDREILRRTSVNRNEIMNDNFLVLTGQEEYVNPHTREVEVDTSAFKYRWVNGGGERYYTNREEEDPNRFLQRPDYQRTPVRKRKNE